MVELNAFCVSRYPTVEYFVVSAGNKDFLQRAAKSFIFTAPEHLNGGSIPDRDAPSVIHCHDGVDGTVDERTVVDLLNLQFAREFFVSLISCPEMGDVAKKAAHSHDIIPGNQRTGGRLLEKELPVFPFATQLKAAVKEWAIASCFKLLQLLVKNGDIAWGR